METLTRASNDPFATRKCVGERTLSLQTLAQHLKKHGTHPQCEPGAHLLMDPGGCTQPFVLESVLLQCVALRPATQPRTRGIFWTGPTTRRSGANGILHTAGGAQCFDAVVKRTRDAAPTGKSVGRNQRDHVSLERPARFVGLEGRCHEWVEGVRIALLEHEEEGARYASALRARMHRVAADVPEASRKTAIYLSPSGDRIYGGTRRSIQHDILRFAGLTDVAAESHSGFPDYRVETLLGFRPDVVVTKTAMAQQLCNRPGLNSWPPCLGEAQFVELDEALLDLGGPAMVDATEALHRALSF